jgi:hypothetical protein
MMDLSALASNLGPIAQQLAPIAGALAGGSAASKAGSLAAIGDYHHEQNQRTYENVKQYADMLEKIGMDPENWSEEARNQAMQERMNLLSPKTVAKIYSNPGSADKLMSQSWENIRQASARPVDTQAQTIEKNAAAGRIPALQKTGEEAGGVGPSMAAAGGALGALGGNPAFGLLGPAIGNAVGTQAAASTAQNQQTLQQPPQGVAYGPLSPGEKATRAYAAIKPFMTGEGGGGAYPVVGVHGGKASVSILPRPEQSVPFTDQSDPSGRIVMAHRNRYDPSGVWRGPDEQPLGPNWVQTGSYGTRVLTTEGATGPQNTVAPKLATGNTPKPVKLTDETVTKNGIVIKQGWNPYTNEVSAAHAYGTTPNRDMIEKNYGLRAAANLRAEDTLALRKANFDYNMSGTTVDVDGSITGVKGTRFTPAGTPIDVDGNPISKFGWAMTKTPAAVQTRARVAMDARDLGDRILQHISDPALKDKFGVLEGNTLEWAVNHGIIGDADIKALQLQLKSLDSMNPAVHQMRNFEVVKDIAGKLGDMGQPFGNFQAGVQTLRDFYAQVATSATKPVVPTAKSPKNAVRSPGPDYSKMNAQEVAAELARQLATAGKAAAPPQ